MGKQHNKEIKRRRRKQYLKRKNELIKNSIVRKESAPAKKAVKKAAAKKVAAKKAAKKAAVKKVAETPDTSDMDLGQVYDAAPEKVDDLKEISGVGPALEKKLHGFGIYTYEQIANWNEKNIEAFDQLLSFKGRIERDDWLKQAKDLASK